MAGRRPRDEEGAAGEPCDPEVEERKRKEEERKARALEIARRRASHFATFGSSDPQGDSVMVGGDSARSLGPWNTAYQLADAKSEAKRKREEAILEGRRKAESDAEASYAGWKPREKIARTRSIPTLKRQSRELCASLIEHVSTLSGVPDGVRAELASEVCRNRRMNDEIFKLFTADAGSSLSIVDCSMIEEDVMRSALREAIHPGLSELALHLCGRGFTDDVCTLLSEEDDVSFGGLETLVLSGAYRLTDEGIMKILKRAAELRTLRLPQCSRIEGNAVLHLPQLTPKLTSLDLSYCGGIPRETLSSALAKLDQLESLTLDGIVDVDDKLLESEQVISGIKNVEIISLRNTGVSDIGLRRLATGLPNLHSIALDYCSITSAGVIDLVDASPGLTSVSLKKCRLVDDAAVVHLVKNCELQKLNLNGLSKITGVSIDAILRGRGKSIEELDLSWLRSLPQTALGCLIESLPGLKVVKLFGCNQVDREFASMVRNEQVCISGLADVVCEDPLAEMAARGRRVFRGNR